MRFPTNVTRATTPAPGSSTRPGTGWRSYTASMITPGRGQEDKVANCINLIFIGNMPMMTTVTPTGEMTLDTTSEAGISRGIINNGQMTNKYELIINVAINMLCVTGHRDGIIIQTGRLETYYQHQIHLADTEAAKQL